MFYFLPASALRTVQGRKIFQCPRTTLGNVPDDNPVKFPYPSPAASGTKSSQSLTFAVRRGQIGQKYECTAVFHVLCHLRTGCNPPLKL